MRRCLMRRCSASVRGSRSSGGGAGLIVAAVWSVLVASAMAGPLDVSTGEHFTATLNTRETFRFDGKRCPAWPHLTGTTSADGTSAPFGAIVGRGSDCVRPTSARTFVFSRGKLTMTTADGDVLRADYGGHLDRSPTLRIDRIVGDFVVTGGTGRFAGVAGKGTITGTENLLSRRGQLVLDGAIGR